MRTTTTKEEPRLKVEGDGGRIEHSELVFGEGVVMVSDETKREKMPYIRCPKSLDGANTQNMMVYVDDVEAHRKRAGEAGAKIVNEPETHDCGEDYW